jgi:hypothetical protein
MTPVAFSVTQAEKPWDRKEDKTFKSSQEEPLPIIPKRCPIGTVFLF